ncbi:MAG: OmpH family outer membrane protein [Paludibacteraceae bacterium]|nr:OmpH family outer membrane protein [Paludibacteraceae bacterium]
MKKTLLSMLAFATIMTTALTACGSKDSKDAETKTAEIIYSPENVSVLPIAYINKDSLFRAYQFAIDAQKLLDQQQEAAEKKLDQRAGTFQSQLNKFQNEVADFQRKLQNNAFLSQDRAEREQQRLAQEEQRLAKEQQNIEQLRSQLAQEIIGQNQELSFQMRDSIETYLKVFNADHRYQLILTYENGDDVLYLQPEIDITAQVIDGLNARMGIKKAENREVTAATDSTKAE